jgi:hypothetical protein
MPVVMVGDECRVATPAVLIFNYDKQVLMIV